RELSGPFRRQQRTVVLDGIAEGRNRSGPVARAACRKISATRGDAMERLEDLRGSNKSLRDLSTNIERSCRSRARVVSFWRARHPVRISKRKRHVRWHETRRSCGFVDWRYQACMTSCPTPPKQIRPAETECVAPRVDFRDVVLPARAGVKH